MGRSWASCSGPADSKPIKPLPPKYGTAILRVGGDPGLNGLAQAFDHANALDGALAAGTAVKAACRDLARAVGAPDIRTDKLGQDTMFARIIALVESASEAQAPIQKLADQVAAWLIPVVFLFLLGVFLITRDVRDPLARAAPRPRASGQPGCSHGLHSLGFAPPGRTRQMA